MTDISDEIEEALYQKDFDEVIRLATAERDRIRLERVKEAMKDALVATLVLTGRNGEQVTFELKAREGYRLDVQPDFGQALEYEDLYHDSLSPIRQVITGVNKRAFYFNAQEVPR